MADKNFAFTIEFRVGDYGWSESYYKIVDGTVSLNDAGVAASAKNLAQNRLKLCGEGVKLPQVRVSDLAVRRDASDFAFNYTTAVGAIDQNETRINPVVAVAALIPNVAIISRMEGANKVYHGQHFLSGIPRDLVGQDQDLQYDAEWNAEYKRFRNYLVSNGWCFPSLSRDSPNDDRPVALIDSATTNVVTLKAGFTTAGWTSGDRVRLINVRKGSNGGSPVVGPVFLLPDVATFRFSPPNLVGTAREGQKTIAHRESSILVPIKAMQAERISHRNRGRPFDSPRGRRKSRAK